MPLQGARRARYCPTRACSCYECVNDATRRSSGCRRSIRDGFDYLRSGSVFVRERIVNLVINEVS